MDNLSKGVDNYVYMWIKFKGIWVENYFFLISLRSLELTAKPPKDFFVSYDIPKPHSQNLKDMCLYGLVPLVSFLYLYVCNFIGILSTRCILY